ncbi:MULTISPECIES: A/G-specific adenine glycosylase [Cytobacillus]|uniref:Adenine DNA glycosylase n=1 Tax=Cytobacillus stercorigallinarum TaxID=2762240 RepID=A0ABR8QVF2_9BACI|nr:A/G-specific adenine glycosylase [Cytobacillus stercorigallinarum]MBD7939505.1 A/G-specific adenine glycosylase [Cytobacillus stercorigallinarum]
MNNSQLKDNPIDIYAFQQDLLSWFEKEQRDLPWRKDKDPYKVWVSEIMLQQTRVDTVIPYFLRFMEAFPTVKDLAEAEEEKVLKLWEGLGYYSRARNLQSAVREVHEQYDGVVPNNIKDISALKGVGPYTAGAILSIAYGEPEPAVDGNVMRVLSRILMIENDIAKASSRKIFEAAVRELISHDNPSYFNQALMELGALICTPTSPSCLLCPVRDHCHAFYEGKQAELPVKTKKAKNKHVQIASAILANSKGELLIRKRSNKGLLANLWEFPNEEIHLQIESDKQQLQNQLSKSYDTHVKINQRIGQLDHVFTHLTWHINLYEGEIHSVTETDNVKLVPLEDIKKYPFPVSHQKMFMQYMQHKGKVLADE